MEKFRSNLTKAGKTAAAAMKRVFSGESIRYCLLQIFLLSVVTTLLTEAFSRFSLWKAFGFLFLHPVLFLLNAAILAITLAPGLLTRRKPFYFFLLCILWFASGVIDFFILHNRVTPFNANDFKMLSDGWNVLFHYYSTLQVIGLLLLIVFGISLLVIAFIKFPKSAVPVDYRIRFPLFVTVAGALLACVFLGRGTGILATNFPNIADAYHDYGLPYCFSCSLLDNGISKPSNYSEEVVGDLIDSVSDPSGTPSVSETVTEEVSGECDTNIIFIQLESFFDPKRIEGLEIAEDPIPNFTRLRENYTSGLLTVPSISAGTANTEFEVLTGMNMHDFGTGEYPYKTVLQTKTCESLAYNLKACGLTAHAIHNNIATFYSRNVVYSNLGFDDFDSLEMMQDVEYNQLDWAKDEVLYDEILTALKSTRGADFIFTVSVQGHGSYPDEDILDNSIELVNVDDAYSDDTIYGLKYYISQISEMDAFIGELTDYLSGYDEPVVLVLYGDHLPGFDFTDENLNRGTTLETEYVIWSNFETEVEHRDLYSYQLSAYTLGRLGIHEGLVTKLQQKYLGGGFETEEDYLSNLQVLSYDMLYGEQYCFDGENPYEPTELTYGFYQPAISGISVIKSGDSCYLTVGGSGFTSYSRIYINGTAVEDTIYISENQLFSADLKLTEGDLITVITTGAHELMLSSSGDYEFTEDSIVNPVND